MPGISSQIEVLCMHNRIIMGPHTQFEYLLVCQILSLLRNKQMYRDLHDVHKIYTACFELCQGAVVSLSLSEKNC